MSRLLTSQDDSGGFEFVGNAFQVKDKDARKLMKTGLKVPKSLENVHIQLSCFEKMHELCVRTCRT